MNLSNKTILSLKIIVTILIILPICYILHKMTTATTFAGVVMYGFYLLGFISLFGCVFSFMFTGVFATNFIDFLLYPKQYFKEAPIILSRQEGLIAFERYLEAEEELLALQKEKPSSPEIVMLLAKLHCAYMNNYPAAIKDFEYYLSHRKFRYNSLNIQILFTYVEYLLELQEVEKAVNILQKEQHLFLYSKTERKAIKSRLSAIKR